MKIYLLNGSSEKRSFLLEKEVTVVGRGSSSDIVIDDPSVSRRHAKIIKKGDRFYAEDLGSQNGTWINGHPINPNFQIEIKEGDSIGVGNVSMSFGKPFSEEGMVTQFSISLSDRAEESWKDLLSRAEQITDRDKLETIYDLSTVLLQSFDITEICQDMLDSVFSCLPGIDSGAVLLVDPESGEPKEIIARTRSHEEAGEAKYSHSIVKRVIEEGKAIVMADVRAEGEEDLSNSIVMMRLKSLMCVPLISKSEIHGVIYVHSVRAPKGFSKDDLFMLTALSIPAALAIENAKLFAERGLVEEALEKERIALEKRIEKRTNELANANRLLKQEIEEHRAAQENLKKMHEQLKEANKNLELAYARMRDSKDRLRSHVEGEGIVFLTDENGQVLGFNDKALEATGLSRFKLLGLYIGEIFDEESRAKLEADLRDAAAGLFHQTQLRFASGESSGDLYQAKLSPINLQAGKNLLLSLQKPFMEA
ncbi:MAG: FHA domain-containing protein [Deltaproteobacteria bacterium]|nr:FHA domain-containing protein [Deltaproteobacteria bacterium]MBW1934290.1 FHA domain-containing protein [Deltaproteobacteria bacterium]